MKTLLIAITVCLLVAGCQIQSLSTISKIQSNIHDVIEEHKQKVVSIRLPDPDGRTIGSGVLFTRKMTDSKERSEYIVVTNNHVLQGVKDFEVILHGKHENEDCYVDSSRTNRIKLYGKDALTDLAVISVNIEKSPCDRYGPYAAFRLDERYRERESIAGDFVIAIGAPLGHQETSTFGIVSATNRAIPGFLAKFIQTDAPINPGNSGGALIDMKGNLLGINTLIAFDPRGRDGLGFALEWEFVQPLVKQLILNNGHIPRVDLGIRPLTERHISRHISQPIDCLSSIDREDGVRTGCFGPLFIDDQEEWNLILSVNNQRVYNNMDYWIEASSVTSSGKADIALLTQSEPEHVVPMPTSLSLNDGFSIPVEYLFHTIDFMMRGYSDNKLFIRETKCLVEKQEVPCGVRIERENHEDFKYLENLIDRDIVNIAHSPITNLSSLINFIEIRKQDIGDITKKLQKSEQKLNRCKRIKKNDYDGETDEIYQIVIDNCILLNNINTQKYRHELQQLQELSIVVRHDGDISTQRFIWDTGFPIYPVPNP